MRTVVEIITPGRAEELLQCGSLTKRKIRWAHVGIYARDMAEREWRLNGESIIIGPGGEVLDGNHRLLACIKAGIPFETVVSYADSIDDVNTIDTGRTRDIKDALHIRCGEPVHKKEVGLLRIILKWISRPPLSIDIVSARFDIAATNEAVYGFREDIKHTFNDKYYNSKRRVGRLRRNSLTWLFIDWYFNNFCTLEQSAVLKLYADRILDGTGLYSGSGLHHARENIVNSSIHGFELSLLELWRIFCLGLETSIKHPQERFSIRKWNDIVKRSRFSDPGFYGFTTIFFSDDAVGWHSCRSVEMGPMLESMSTIRNKTRKEMVRVS